VQGGQGISEVGGSSGCACETEVTGLATNRTFREPVTALILIVQKIAHANDHIDLLRC
jgi:hypothetical protein